MMRILIVGADSQYAIERPYLHYLSQDEHVGKVELFAAQNQFLAYYRKSLFHKVIYRAGLSGILQKINSLLKAKIESFKPDVVFVFKGMEIFPSTLKWIREQGIKVANYNPDNPFIFSGSGSGNKNVTQSISLYDLHLTYNARVKEKIDREYKIPTLILPFGFDVDNALYEAATGENEILKICFLGNADEFRAAFIDGLGKSGLKADVYGQYWDRFPGNPNVCYHGAVYGDDFWKTLRKYRVQLNIMRPHNPDSHNMRSFEIAGIGGIQLAPRTPEHEIYFEEGKEIFLYADQADCIEKAKYILSLSKEAAGEIRIAARKRSLEMGYSYRNRASQVVQSFKSLLGRQ